MALVRDTYEATRSYPPEERFGITAQLRKAVVSVPANIAEGHGRVHRGDYMHHLSIAHGSLWEVETLLQIAQQLGMSPSATIDPLLGACHELGRMLGALMRALQRAGPASGGYNQPAKRPKSSAPKTDP